MCASCVSHLPKEMRVCILKAGMTKTLRVVYNPMVKFMYVLVRGTDMCARPCWPRPMHHASCIAETVAAWGAVCRARK